MTDRINDFADLETAAEQFQEAINSAYTANGPLSVRKNYRNIHWCPKTLRREGRKSADYLMLPRSQGIGLTTKEP
jgi:hypothetical protein